VLDKENIDTIIQSDLIKSKVNGEKAQEERRINNNHNRLDELAEYKIIRIKRNKKL
jgi:hypothetical protein